MKARLSPAELGVVRAYVIRYHVAGPIILVGAVFAAILVALSFLGDDADRPRLLIGAAAIFVGMLALALAGAVYVVIRTRRSG